MAVYVDDMMAPYGRLIMCHMLADSDEELLAMADKIGVQRKWHQHAGTYKSHFDIALSKRRLAVDAGAEEITMRRAGEITRERRLLAEGYHRCPAWNYKLVEPDAPKCKCRGA